MSLIRPLRKNRRPLTARFFVRFRRNTEAEFSQGNTLALLRTGSDFFGELFAALEQATSAIYLEFYIVRDDRTGKRLADILLGAARRGVAVYLLYDYIGSFDTPTSYFRTLEKNGVRTLPFNPPPFRRGLTWFDKRDHRKIAVIDSRVAFTGGLNIGEEYTGSYPGGSYWRDVGIRLEGPSVMELEQLFSDNWFEESAARPLGSCALKPTDHQGCDNVAIVNGGPHHNRSRIRAAFRIGIAASTESIRIQTPYFIPGPRFIRALLRAVRRGVHVQLILPGESDVPLVALINRSSYATLIKGGIEIFEQRGTILHAKVMLIDGSWSVMGSANLDQRSFHRNYEVNVIVVSNEFGGQVEEMFSDDLSCARRITLEEHERRGFMVRFLEKVIAPLNWFL